MGWILQQHLQPFTWLVRELGGSDALSSCPSSGSVQFVCLQCYRRSCVSPSWLPCFLSLSEQVDLHHYHKHPKHTWLPQLRFGLLPSVPSPLWPCPMATLCPLLPLSMQCKNSVRETCAPQKRTQTQTLALTPTVNTNWRGLSKAWGGHSVEKALVCSGE